MNNKELEIFLEYFFLYKWTNLKEDFLNLKIAKKFLNKISIKKNLFLKKILLKLNKEDNNKHIENNNFYNSKKNLDLICSIIFLRNVIINKNKKEILPLNFKDFENIKIEYAHLRVDLLNKIKKNFTQQEYEKENSSLNYDEYIQKIADQLEDKYHSIKNDLGYEFLRYKDIRLIKTLDTPNNYLIINSEQELNRSENNININ
jgi:hypothetical protein|tara:strand:+ start:92 stop:700 length:609 start_codon:yes stop_codon:yes gene_type:complete